jgi:hypothetical protein
LGVPAGCRPIPTTSSSSFFDNLGAKQWLKRLNERALKRALTTLSIARLCWFKFRIVSLILLISLLKVFGNAALREVAAAEGFR